MATTIKAAYKELRNSTFPLTRIVKFLKKYPPSQYSSLATGQAIPTSKQRIVMKAGALSAMNVPQANSLPTVDGAAASASESIAPSAANLNASAAKTKAVKKGVKAYPPNPFLPYRNPETGHWRGPKLGLRRQADLYNYARQLEVEDLLPASIKSSTYKQARALERGLAVRGTGEGQQVKGHKWERTKASTLEKRRKAMEEMPELIREWEQRGHGRGWKKYPSGKSR